MTVTGATEFRTTFVQPDHIVDFKTAPDKVFDVGVPNKVSNILIDDATGATTIGSDVRTDGIWCWTNGVDVSNQSVATTVIVLSIPQ
jgi:hypothetical protein